MRINLSQIAAGAMQQYLKDDDARIAAAAKRRAADEDFERQKKLLNHEYTLRGKNEKEKDIRAAAVKNGLSGYHYPVDSNQWKNFSDHGMPKLHQNEELAKLHGKGGLPMLGMNWAEQSAQYMLEHKPELLQSNPEMANQILSSALRNSRVGNFGSKEMDMHGNPLPGRVMLSTNFPHLHKLAQTVMSIGGKSTFARNLLDFYGKEATAPNVSDKESQTYLNNRARHNTKLHSTQRVNYIPKGMFDLFTSNLVSFGVGNSIRQRHANLGRFSIGTDEYQKATQAYLTDTMGHTETSYWYKDGSYIGGKKPTRQTLDILISTIGLHSNYNFIKAAEVRGGRTITPVISDAAIKEAEKSRIALVDHTALLRDSERLIQLNDRLQSIASSPDASGAQSATHIQIFREWVTKGADLLIGLKESNKDASAQDLKDVDDGKEFGTIFSKNRIMAQLGINSMDEKSSVLSDKDGPYIQVALGEQIQTAIANVDSRLADMRKRLETGEKWEGVDLTKEMIEAEAEYSHLKIRTIFTIAKVIQGGTGGRGVSNMDFENVAKSLAESAFSSLRKQNVMYSTVRNKAVRSYVRHSFGSSPEISSTAQRDAMTDKVINLYGYVQEYHKRKAEEAKLEEDFLGDFGGDLAETSKRAGVRANRNIRFKKYN